ncbi:MAG: hypothetical protein JXR96_23070 [Deltaproteobacteria bacterium]|nr:hypothetical protein [Deltaproteobacteria bacterium]
MTSPQEQLLGIDVQSALRKVSLGRLQSMDQVPLALVRQAARARPRRVEIRLGRRRLDVSHDGDALPEAVTELLEVLLGSGEELARHVALEKLEALRCEDLLVAFCLGGRVVLDTGAQRLDFDGRRPCRGGARRERGFALSIRGVHRRREAESAELVEHLRFADFEVLLDGARISHGARLEGQLLQMPFDWGGYAGCIGLPEQGLGCRLWALVDGVVHTQIWDSPADGAVYDAVVICPEGRVAEGLERARRMVGRLYAGIRLRYADLGARARERVEQVLFRMADFGAGPDVLGELPVFRTIGGRRVPAAALRELARGGVLRAIGPDADLAAYSIGAGVFLLGERARDFVERHLGLEVREPHRRLARLPGWRRVLAEIPARAGALYRRIAARLAAGRILRPEEESAEQARLRQGLQSIFDQGLVPGLSRVRVELARGRLGAWRWIDGAEGQRLVLKTGHRRVRAMARACADPAMGYPAVMLLLEGADAFGAKREQAAGQIAGLPLDP